MIKAKNKFMSTFKCPHALVKEVKGESPGSLLGDSPIPFKLDFFQLISYIYLQLSSDYYNTTQVNYVCPLD